VIHRAHLADAGTSADIALIHAHLALDEGDSQSARELAQSVLVAAKTSADEHTEARALAFLAHCDGIGSRLQRASDTSRRAARLFERLGEPEGEAMALATLTRASMRLGRADEAFEAALLCVRLCEPRGPDASLVIAHDAFGVACCWAGNYERAHEAMEAAVEVASRCTPAVSPYQPRLNQTWVEAQRLVDERHRTGSMTSLAKMAELVKELARLEDAGEAAPLMSGLGHGVRTVSLVLTALLACWQGRTEVAKMAHEFATRSLLGTVTWLDAMVRWAAAELAWAQQDWPAAEQAFIEMRGLALAAQHEPFALSASLLLANAFESQGKSDQAVHEYRALRVRERRMVGEVLMGRISVVERRLDARRSAQHLQEALLAAKQFERWSLEDALTGLANRRAIDQALEERLEASRASGKPLTVAMIDVDKFKQVNDTHTHQVGDRVLKTLAAIMSSQVREKDLPARWAGDEFVVLFDDAPEEVARQVCERIHAAIAAFDWGSVAVGLRVSVSIGLSQAREGDTMESVLGRSDESMYETKSMELIST